MRNTHQYSDIAPGLHTWVKYWDGMHERIEVHLIYVRGHTFGYIGPIGVNCVILPSKVNQAHHMYLQHSQMFFDPGMHAS